MKKDLEKFREVTKEMLEEEGIEIEEHVILEIEDEEYSVGKTLSNYLNYNDDVEYDFTVFGNKGNRAQNAKGFWVGRIANHVLKHCVINPVIVP